jgi:tetratricopeptide (TPR) repeat protein
MPQNLSTADAARIVGLSEARIRELLRGCLGIAPRRGHRYALSFQELVILRTARALLEQRVPAARVKRALRTLAEQLPPERTLSGVRIYAEGGRVTVHDGDRKWDAETGQALFCFDVAELERETAAPRLDPEPRAERAPSGLARGEFERGVELEESDPAAARDAYTRAIELDPDLTDAHVNLGRLLHEAGDARGAIARYEAALLRSAQDPVAHFNLALALEDVRELAQAAEHYRRALASDPDFADAHYNLAELSERMGQLPEALRHYHAYKQLTE